MENKNIKLRTIFMGTSELSATILNILIEEKYNIVGVYTKPDSKLGRKQELTSPLVKKIAEKHSIAVFQPKKFTEDVIAELKNLKPDLIIVAAYGKILPKAVLDMPGFGCLNVHVSLLPKFRGPSPVQNALLAGEKETGATIMLMDEGIDTGDIITQEAIKIEQSDNAQILMDKLAALGAKLLIKTIKPWIEQKIDIKIQDHAQATFCQLIEREDGHINWTEDAESIFNRYRALTPWPGIFTYWKQDNNAVRLKLKQIEFQKSNPLQKHNEGEVFEIGEDVGVQTADGVIILKEIQREGKKAANAKDFINGYPKFIGSILF